MTFEEDLELALMNLVSTKWSISEGSLAKSKMLFHRNMRKVEGTLKEPNVIFAENVDVLAWDNEGMAECMASIIIRTRIQAEGTENTEVDATKVLKKDMRVEIFRILKEETLPDGWEWGHITRRVNSDNFDMQAALLGEDLFVSIAYQRSG